MRSDARIVEAIHRSYRRCIIRLLKYWPVVEQLAAAAIKASDGTVIHEQIEALWKSYGIDRGPSAASKQATLPGKDAIATATKDSSSSAADYRSR
jgi:hypothetical protein